VLGSALGRIGEGMHKRDLQSALMRKRRGCGPYRRSRSPPQRMRFKCCAERAMYLRAHPPSDPGARGGIRCGEVLPSDYRIFYPAQRVVLRDAISCATPSDSVAVVSLSG
jgi:hypothetical protein